MENSTIKPKVATKKVKANDDMLVRVVELSDRMNFVMKMLQDHADEIITIRNNLDRVRNRMGI